jgi:hypothetical protein
MHDLLHQVIVGGGKVTPVTLHRQCHTWQSWT